MQMFAQDPPPEPSAPAFTSATLQLCPLLSCLASTGLSLMLHWDKKNPFPADLVPRSGGKRKWALMTCQWRHEVARQV